MEKLAGKIRNGSKRIILSLIILGIFALFVWCPIIGITTGYQYEKDIGCHFEKAISATTPEEMRQEILLGCDALQNDGVTNSSYVCIILKTSRDSMSYYYAQFYGLVERLDVLINLTNNGNITGEYTDIPGQRLDNIRTELENLYCNSDHIGACYVKHAWYIENHIINHFVVWFVWLFFFILALITFVIFVIFDAGYCHGGSYTSDSIFRDKKKDDN